MLRASEDAASRAATERLTRAESAERAAAVRQKRLARLGKIMTKKEAELARDPTFVAHHALLQARRRRTTTRLLWSRVPRSRRGRTQWCRGGIVNGRVGRASSIQLVANDRIG